MNKAIKLLEFRIKELNVKHTKQYGYLNLSTSPIINSWIKEKLKDITEEIEELRQAIKILKQNEK